MKGHLPDHYATLGLHRTCSVADIRKAYRLLAKRHHPDVNPGSADAMARIQALNEAYEVLCDPAARQAYDQELARAPQPPTEERARPTNANVSEDVQLNLLDFLRGTTLTIAVRDPGHRGGVETYTLVVPPETAPGSRFRVKRAAPFERGFVIVRVKARPDYRFKVRGSDLRCDLKISAQRATAGGTESLRGLTGSPVRVTIPAHVGRGEIIRVTGEGLPRPRGGRGDLLVRITYRPDVRITQERR